MAEPTVDVNEPLLRANLLTRRFGGLTAVNGVSLDLHVGEVHAVIGTNGAGKSTLINMLSGEMPATSGSIHFDGHDITDWSQPQRARAGIGRSYQRTTIFPEFSVLENCRLCAQAALPRAWAVWEAAQHCEAEPRDRARGAGRRRPRRRVQRSPPARSATAASASWRSPCAWPPGRVCCCSTSRWPAWAPRRPTACSRCWPR